MRPRILVTIAAALMAACGGSVTRASDAGGGGGGQDAANDDAGVNQTGVDATAMTETGMDATAVTESGPPVVVDSAPPCGAPGQSCCGTSCNAGNTCVVIDMMSQCEACGNPGQPCCTTVPACANADEGCFGGPVPYCMNNGAGTLGQPGDRCTTTCADPADTCLDNGMAAYCIECGGLGNPCCGTTCGTGLQCTAGTCR